MKQGISDVPCYSSMQSVLTIVPMQLLSCDSFFTKRKYFSRLYFSFEHSGLELFLYTYRRLRYQKQQEPSMKSKACEPWCITYSEKSANKLCIRITGFQYYRSSLLPFGHDCRAQFSMIAILARLRAYKVYSWIRDRIIVQTANKLNIGKMPRIGRVLFSYQQTSHSVDCWLRNS